MTDYLKLFIKTLLARKQCKQINLKLQNISEKLRSQKSWRSEWSGLILLITLAVEEQGLGGLETWAANCGDLFKVPPKPMENSWTRFPMRGVLHQVVIPCFRHPIESVGWKQAEGYRGSNQWRQTQSYKYPDNTWDCLSYAWSDFPPEEK